MCVRAGKREREREGKQSSPKTSENVDLNMAFFSTCRISLTKSILKSIRGCQDQVVSIVFPLARVEMEFNNLHAVMSLIDTVSLLPSRDKLSIKTVGAVVVAQRLEHRLTNTGLWVRFLLGRIKVSPFPAHLSSAEQFFSVWLDHRCL